MDRYTKREREGKEMTAVQGTCMSLIPGSREGIEKILSDSLFVLVQSVLDSPQRLPRTTMKDD